MKRLLLVLTFGLAVIVAAPVFGQLPGLDGGDAKGTNPDRDKQGLESQQARTINVTDKDRKIKIVIGVAGEVEVEVTKSFKPDQLAELKDKYPKLAEALDEFPAKAGPYKVDLTIGLTSKVKAASLLALKEKSPAAFDIYKRYHKRQSDEEGLASTSNDDSGIGALTEGGGQSYFQRNNKRRNLPVPTVSSAVKNAKEVGKDGDDIGDLVRENKEKDKKDENKRDKRKDK